ncbi:Repeat domain-containing protein [Spirosomataceae bacterium TFI 002]|nr:Repeat domain-containing protein [Spirosomataceae bacterium TFI 002]
MNRLFLKLILLSCLLGCKNTNEEYLFSKVPAEQSGLYFENRITENVKYNVYDYHNLYNGGGIGVLDVNNDGLKDLFVTGNQVADKLYLNRGDLKFEDISRSAGINSEGWSTGISIADINEDGFDDIYICKAGNETSELLKNKLFINQKDGTFKEESEIRGLADSSLSTQAAFFDFDKDGDLDVYILTTSNIYRNPNGIRKPAAYGYDKLYLNQGKGYFKEAQNVGIETTTHGLGLAIADVNNDGFEDVLASSDFLPNDALYINQNGQNFINSSSKSLPFLGRFSMGNDIADFNEDGFLDIITTDMLPEENEQQKKMLMTSYQVFEAELRYGYLPQFTRNMLFVNDGYSSKTPYFSEQGTFYGVHATDWSWSPLFVDFDNDGHKDLSITNGYLRDVTDSDYVSYNQNFAKQTQKKEELKMFINKNTANLPQLRKVNKLYRNTIEGFEDVSQIWSEGNPSFSNGSVFCDLDNDGDHDFIVNNINEPLFLYQNHSKNNFIKVNLEGPSHNKHGQGVRLKLTLENDSARHYYQSLTRGYLSSVDPSIIFGLGKDDKAKSLEVFWPDGKYEIIKQPIANSIVNVQYAKATVSKPLNSSSQPLFEEIEVDFQHRDERFIDFNTENLLLQKYSNSGPALAKGDINGDGYLDFVVVGEQKNAFVFLQNQNGEFKQSILDINYQGEVSDVILCDFNNDKLLDIYLMKGSNEFNLGPNYQDEILLGNGNGSFRKATKPVLPILNSPGSFVMAIDIDADGDIDILRGGNVSPARFPESTSSFVLVNNGNLNFELNDLGSIGILRDAVKVDLDKNGFDDIVAVGHFMPPIVLYNQNGILKESKLAPELSGLWNTIELFENDNKVSFVMGNIGQNYRYKFTSSQPLVLNTFEGESYIPSFFLKEKKQIITARDELIRQLPKLRTKYPNYLSYAIDQEFDWLEESNYSLREMKSGMLYYSVEAKFTFEAFPTEAQKSTVQTISVGDFNGDQKLDIFMAGNNSDLEPSQSGYVFGNRGQLWSKGSATFTNSPNSKSGLNIKGYAKKSLIVKSKKANYLIVSQYNGPLLMFKNEN